MLIQSISAISAIVRPAILANIGLTLKNFPVKESINAIPIGTSLKMVLNRSSLSSFLNVNSLLEMINSAARFSFSAF